MVGAAARERRARQSRNDRLERVGRGDEQDSRADHAAERGVERPPPHAGAGVDDLPRRIGQRPDTDTDHRDGVGDVRRDRREADGEQCRIRDDRRQAGDEPDDTREESGNHEQGQIEDGHGRSTYLYAADRAPVDQYAADRPPADQYAMDRPPADQSPSSGSPSLRRKVSAILIARSPPSASATKTAKARSPPV